jgi:ankyrin repeat protein
MDLIGACIRNNLEEAKRLLSEGVTIEQKAHSMRITCFNGQLEMIKLLVEYGANIHANNDEALQMARYNSQTETINYLKNRLILEKINEFN